MRLALVPTMTAAVPGLGSVATPALPPWLGGRFWQASSLWHERSPESGLVLVGLDITESEALQAAREGVVPLGGAIRFSRADVARMRARHPHTQDLLDLSRDARTGATSGLRATARSKKWALHSRMCDQSMIAVRECVAAYREEAAKIERDLFSSPSGIVGLSTLHQDTFNRSDRDLNGDTMSDGLGVWTVTEGTWSIVGNQAQADAVLGENVAYDSAMSSVGTQRVSVTTRGPESGAFARWSSNQGYLAHRLSNSSTALYVKYGTGLNYASLSTGSSNAVNGDIQSCDCDGTTIAYLLNGSANGSPATDSTVSSGKGCMRGHLVAIQDDFLVEVADSSSIKTINGLARASVKTVNGLAIASVKSWNGLQ